MNQKMKLKPVRIAVMRETVVDLFRENNCRNFIEVGVDKGELSHLILDTFLDIEFVLMVDPWKAYGKYSQDFMDQAFNHVMAWKNNHIRQSRIRINREPSMVAVQKINDCVYDFVFLDALHDYENVKLDIIHWGTRLIDGGILAGDNFEMEGVSQAVRDILPEFSLPEKAKGRVWMTRIKKEYYSIFKGHQRNGNLDLKQTKSS